LYPCIWILSITLNERRRQVMASKEELLELLKDGVINYKDEQVVKASNDAVAGGLPALEMIMDGLAAGMEVVG
jgi:methanogenic corrinoid protein MtbC1